MDFLVPLVNLRSGFYFTSGFMELVFLFYLFNWIIRLIKHDNK